MPDPDGATPAPIVVFDVTETILDLGVLAPVFEAVFGTAAMLRRWFDQVVLYSEALTLARSYANTAAVGVAVLHMLAESEGRAVSQSDLEAFRRLFATMPTYPDTPAALETLRGAGIRMTALSNTPTSAVTAQLGQAGLLRFFEAVHSIDDEVRQYKPARDSYAWLARTLGVPPSALWLVSCHAFDTLGAAAAGWRTALVLRPGNAPIGLGIAPDIVGSDLRTIAHEIVARTSARGATGSAVGS